MVAVTCDDVALMAGAAIVAGKIGKQGDVSARQAAIREALWRNIIAANAPASQKRSARSRGLERRRAITERAW